MLNTTSIFISGLAIELVDMTTSQVAFTLSIAALSEFSKLLVGVCFDLKKLVAYRMYMFCVACVMMGVMATVLTFMRDVITFNICNILFTFFTMGAHSQYVTMLGDLVTSDELPRAVTVSRTIMGIFQILVTPAIGRIKDLWNSFQYDFILMSVVHIAIVTGYSILYHCSRKTKLRNRYQKSSP